MSEETSFCQALFEESMRAIIPETHVEEAIKNPILQSVFYTGMAAAYQQLNQASIDALQAIGKEQGANFIITRYDVKEEPNHE